MRYRLSKLTLGEIGQFELDLAHAHAHAHAGFSSHVNDTSTCASTNHRSAYCTCSCDHVSRHCKH